MESFPAFVPLKGRRVIVVGAGEPAEAKLRLFERSPADLLHMDAASALAAGALAGAALVFVAVAEESEASAIADAARTAGALVNVVDRPGLSDFITPAIVDRGPIVAGIGTGGAAPVLATLLRGELEARWPSGLGLVGELSRRLQGEVRAAYVDLPARRAFWRRLLSGPAAEAAEAGDLARAEMLARDALASDAAPTGRVWLLDCPSDPDRLTLAAVRALGAADRIVADEGAAPTVLAYARRDAERSSPVPAATLAEWARKGEAVLRLDPTPEETAVLQAAGVRVEALPTA